MGLVFGLNSIDKLDERLAEKGELLERLVGSERAKSEMRKAMRPITENAKARVHNITGQLGKAIEVHITGGSAANLQIEAGISYKRHPKAHYAHMVEGGHGGPHGPAKPHPFWQPAVDAYGDEAVEALKDTLNSLIDEMFG